jgi:hypothetical protein
METTRQFNPDPGTIAWSAIFIDKVHSCTDCPIRKLAIKQPKSIFARLHLWHKTWWPGWKAHQAQTCPFTGNVGTHASTKSGQ